MASQKWFYVAVIIGGECFWGNQIFSEQRDSTGVLFILGDEFRVIELWRSPFHHPNV